RSQQGRALSGEVGPSQTRRFHGPDSDEAGAGRPAQRIGRSVSSFTGGGTWRIDSSGLSYPCAGTREAVGTTTISVTGWRTEMCSKPTRGGLSELNQRCRVGSLNRDVHIV